MILFGKNRKAIAKNNPLSTELVNSDIVVSVDIAGIKPNDPNEFINARLVDGQGNAVSIGGSATETDVVDIIDLVTGDQLRNATTKTIALPDLKKYRRYAIQVFNGLDQDVKVVPWNTAPVVLEDDSIGFFATASTDDKAYSWTIPKKDASNSSLFFLNLITPKSNGAGTLKVKNPDKLFETMYNVAGTLMMLAYKAAVTPTSGSVTIRFIGFKR